MAARMYRITVAGRLDPLAAESLAGFEVAPSEPDTTVIRGLMDQSALYGLLRRIEVIGLELVAVWPEG